MTLLEQLLAELEQQPSDVRLLQKVGELFQKRGDHVSGAKYFAKVAEYYERDGFLLKAVALNKQVLKLDPSHIDVLARLASLHSTLGLNEEAVSYLRQARTAFIRAGRRSDAIEMERRLTEKGVAIDPRPTAKA